MSTAKTPRKAGVVVLHITPDRLANFPSDVAPTRPQPTAAIKNEPSPSVQPPDLTEKSSESNSTPVPTNGNDVADPNSLAPPKVDGRRKRGGATTSGRKRAPPSIDPNAPPRERGRPGPKKKPRLPDGTIDRTGEAQNGAAPRANPVPAHKLGPKANTGNINANLRALDRTGKPCRKWNKKPLQLKSFTGTVWTMGSWKAPRGDQGFAGDVKSDSASSSEIKPVHESSAIQSERSHSHVGDDTVMTGMQSSPAPPTAMA